MNAPGHISELLSRARSLSREPKGVLVVPAYVLSAAKALGGRPSPLHGTRSTEGGEEIVRACSLTPAEDTERVGVVLGGGIVVQMGEAVLDPSDPPRAAMDGWPMQVVVSDPERYRDRVRALPGAEALVGKTVVLVGLGSVGSSIGASLARLGVRVVAFDPDLLMMENLIRWGLLADHARHSGRRKAFVFTELLRDTVPGALVSAHALDVVREAGRFETLAAEASPSLVIAATDTRDSRREVNALARRLHVPALFVGLSDGARSARFEVVDGPGACHLCATIGEGSGMPHATRPSLRPYSTVGADEPKAVPALPANIAVANAMATRIAVGVLAGEGWERFFQNGEQRGRVMFVGLEPEEWVFEGAYDRLVYAPERAAECPACGHGGNHDG